jgi:CBS domain-containing protein
MLTTRVRDLMRPILITCPPATPLSAVAATLTRHQIHALIVSDPAGMPLGVVSDIDLLARGWLDDDLAVQAELRAVTAGKIMSAPAVTVDAAAPASDAAARLRALHIHRLVVTDMDRAVGVIAVSDLVRGLAPPPVQRATVGEAMARGIVVCRADTSLAAAARTMTDRRSRTLVIVSPHGRPLGVVTGFDLLAYCDGGNPADLVTRVMHPPLSIGPQASLRAAAEQMLAARVHRLLVVDQAEPDSVPLGLISTGDLTLELAASVLAGRAA